MCPMHKCPTTSVRSPGSSGVDSMPSTTAVTCMAATCAASSSSSASAVLGSEGDTTASGVFHRQSTRTAATSAWCVNVCMRRICTNHGWRTSVKTDGAVGDRLPFNAIQRLPHKLVFQSSARCDTDGSCPDVSFRPLQQGAGIHIPAANTLI